MNGVIEMRKIYRPAIGDIRTVVRTEKINKILSSNARVLTLYGASGNGKSMLKLIKALSRIFKAKRWQQTYILAGKDITTLEKRFIEANTSVLNWFPFAGKWRYSKQGKGGSRIEMMTPTGIKYIYLTPFDKVNAYQRILGMTLNGVIIDEAVEADDFFLQEMLLRVLRTSKMNIDDDSEKNSWLMMSSNGGNPASFFYTGIVDKSHPMLDVPQEELQYFVEESMRIPESEFYHMKLEDNPAYTDEQIKMIYNSFPVGSFQYYSKVLGVRGFTEFNVFSSFANDESYWIRRNELVDDWSVRDIVMSVDSGGHVFSTKYMAESEYVEGDFGTGKGGHTVMVSVGFNRDKSKVVLLDVYFPNHMEQGMNVERINKRVYEKLLLGFPNAIRSYMFSDNADPSMLATLQNRVRNVNTITGSTKRDNAISMTEPVVIELILQWFLERKIKILDTPENRKWLKGALIEAKQDKDGKLVDNMDWHADVMDALKGVFSSMYRLLAIYKY